MLSTSESQRLPIGRRNWKFGRGTEGHRWWHGGDAGRTAFFNALSSTFPVGEKFFMASVRRYRDLAPDRLQQEIDDFIFQESMHTREHVFFNKQAREAGYDITPAEDRAARTIAWAKKRESTLQLAATCALEHFTATLAHSLLADPAHLAGADEEAQKMWRWHAIEEIEHKAVAFDTWLCATRKLPAWRRWLRRSLVMAATTWRFHYVIFANTRDLLAQDGKNDFATWMRLLHFLYVRPGAMRDLLVSAIGYMKPGFHPWQHDDSNLVQQTLATLSPTQAEVTPS